MELNGSLPHSLIRELLESKKNYLNTALILNFKCYISGSSQPVPTSLCFSRYHTIYLALNVTKLVYSGQS